MNFRTRFSSWDKCLTDKRQGKQQTDRQPGWQVCLDKAIGFCQRAVGAQKERPNCYREIRRGFCRRGAEGFVFQAQAEYTTLRRKETGKGPHQPRKQP